ncbi:hypothetical protein [Paenibacillus sp. TSA_86.1]|jgi:hypothetical protein|uniref:hypothetical protein n=1 Tax=Paenibacillus sp. TSA_86.1 TaxID=3415649 RepID=UPI0040463BFF
MKGTKPGRVENQVYSSRVWRTVIYKSGYVIYIATANQAKVEVLLSGRNITKRLVFNKGGRVIVGGGGTSHYNKPHRAITL